MEIKNDYKGKPKHDYNKHRSRNDYKDKRKDNGERRPKKSSRYKKKTARAMVAGASDIDYTSSDASFNSNNEEEQERRKDKRHTGKNFTGLNFIAQGGFCGMAHSKKGGKHNSDSNSDSEEEVRHDPNFLLEENARLNELLDNHDDVLRKTNKEKREFRSLLGDARTEID